MLDTMIPRRLIRALDSRLNVRNKMMKLALKVAYLAAIVLLCFPVFVHAQADSRKKSLFLSIKIISHDYIDNNVVDMKLRVQFRNIGNRSLILYKPAILLSEIQVFEDVERPSSDTFAEVLAVISDPPAGISNEVIRNRPNKDFIFIAPGRTHQMDERVVTRIRARNRVQLTGAKDDRYYLIVKVLTWDVSQQDLAARLRRMWKRFGVLWSDAVESEAILFTVER